MEHYIKAMTHDERHPEFVSPRVDRYLFNWLGKGSWYTSHSLDQSRFFQFVKAFLRCAKVEQPYDMEALIFRVVKHFHPNLRDEMVQEKAHEFQRRFETLAEYEGIEFPDIYIETRGPHHLWEHFHKMGRTEHDCDRLVQQEYGPNWRSMIDKSE